MSRYDYMWDAEQTSGKALIKSWSGLQHVAATQSPKWKYWTITRVVGWLSRPAVGANLSPGPCTSRKHSFSVSSLLNYSIHTMRALAQWARGRWQSWTRSLLLVVQTHRERGGLTSDWGRIEWWLRCLNSKVCTLPVSLLHQEVYL